MAKRSKDTDYLAVSAEIRAMEQICLTREKLEQAASVPAVEEALKIVQESGYPMLTSTEASAIDEAIQEKRRWMERQLDFSDEEIMEVFCCPHDYHNLKSLLKARFTGVDSSHLLVNLGRMHSEEMKRAIEENAWDRFPGMMGEMAAAAKALLETTRDGQLMDVFLDRACFAEQLNAAGERDSAFLTGFLRRSIDSVNLRALVRTLRMGKTAEFLRQVLIPGGEIGEEALLTVSANHGALLVELYSTTVFAEAAKKADLTGTEPLTDFERLCDDAVAAYLEQAERIPFGEETVIAYLAKKEWEFTNLRILLLGRRMGLPADEIKKRLRA